MVSYRDLIRDEEPEQDAGKSAEAASEDSKTLYTLWVQWSSGKPPKPKPYRGPRVSLKVRALALKALELRGLHPYISKSEVADWIEEHCTDDDKGKLKRHWSANNPITEDDVKNAYNRMREVANWPTWSEDKLPLRE